MDTRNRPVSTNSGTIVEQFRISTYLNLGQAYVRGLSNSAKNANLSHLSPMNTDDVYLVIAAGGRGVRMGGVIPKQFRNFGEMCVLETTIRAFLTQDMPNITRIVLAVPENHLEQVNAWQFGLPVQAVVGGNTRQESVYLALMALPDTPSAIVLIHDAVRPFPPSDPIKRAIESLKTWDSAILVERSTDTLKRVDATGKILGTEPRENVFRAQTPQVARLQLWREAFTWAQITGFQGTDDSSLLEALGKRIRIVVSPTSNLKLTTPEDWTHIHREYPTKLIT